MGVEQAAGVDEDGVLVPEVDGGHVEGELALNLRVEGGAGGLVGRGVGLGNQGIDQRADVAAAVVAVRGKVGGGVD